MSFKKTLWVNVTDRELVQSFQSNSTANIPKFTQGDNIPLEIILLEKTGNDGQVFSNFEINSETLKVALGRVDQAATSGTFTLTFDGDTTSALNYNATAAEVDTALNALTSITTAGGVTVSGSNGGPFTVAFDTVGAQNYITSDLSLIEPSAVLSNIRKQTGDGSTKEIQVLRIQENLLGLTTSFSAIPAPIATISTLIAGASGVNEIQQLKIDRQCIGGVIALAFGGASTSFKYGATAAEVKTSLEGNSNIGANNISVTKVSDQVYTFEFIGTLAGADQAAITVDDSGLDGFSGFSGTLDLDNYSVQSFLNGTEEGDCYLEIELTDGSNITTLCTVAAKIVNDVINSAVTSPPLTPSITFVESINGETGVVTGYYKSGGTDVTVADGGTGASTAAGARTNLGLEIGTNIQAHSAVLDATNASFTIADETKLDYITITQAVNLDTLESDVEINKFKSLGGIWNYDNTVAAEADPGNNNIRFNNATLASITEAYIDDLDINSNNMEALFDLVAANHTMVLSELGTPSVLAIFTVSAVTDQTGYTKLALTLVSSTGSLPADDTDLFVSFIPASGSGSGGGKILQAPSDSTTTSGSTTTAIPADDTVPTYSEGADCGLSVNITPASGSNELIFMFEAMIESSAQYASVALFQGSTCVFAKSFTAYGGDCLGNANFTVKLPAPGTSTYTYTVRYGPPSGTAYLLKKGGSDLFDTTRAAQLIIMEVEP